MFRYTKTKYRYRLTRLGFHFLFVGLFAIVGGSLRGFNLLLVLAGLLIGAVLLQWRSGRANIRVAGLRRGLVSGGHVGETILLPYVVSNSSRWNPIWMIRIRDRLTEVNATNTDSTPSNVTIRPGPSELVASVGSVSANGSTVTSIECQFSKRGIYRLGPTALSSTFPFSLIDSEKQPSIRSVDLAIYPQLIPLRRGWQSLLPTRRDGNSDRSSSRRSYDGEFFGLRPWQSGDHVKQIHWRTTARLGVPAVRQFEQRARHQICLVVDGWCSADQDTDSYELALRLSATFIGELSDQIGGIALVVSDGLHDDRICVAKHRDITPLLHRLAMSTPTREVSTLSRASRTDATVQRDTLADCLSENAQAFRRNDLVVVSTRSIEQARIALRHRPETTTLLWHLDQAGRIAWLDVRSSRVQRFFRNPMAAPAKSRSVHQA